MHRRSFLTLLGGAAAAWPVVARAQFDGRVRRIGALMGGAETDLESSPRVSAFQQGLEKLGWTLGRNLQIDYRWTMAEVEKIRSGASELVSLAPDLMVADGTTRLAALKQATHTIPIVFVFVAEPVAQGFVASLARPGGNITGFTNLEPTVGGKWAQLLKEIAPDTSRVAIMFNPETTPAPPSDRDYALTAAQGLFADAISAPVRSLADIEAAISTLASKPAGGLIVSPDNFTTVNRKLILDLAARYRLPAIYAFRYFVDDGGLASYGVNPIEPFRQAATYVNRILRGEKPAELPVQQPTRFELVINMKTAKALGLTVPLTLQVAADEVIE